MRLHLTAACAAMALTLGSALAADTAPARSMAPVPMQNVPCPMHVSVILRPTALAPGWMTNNAPVALSLDAKNPPRVESNTLICYYAMPDGYNAFVYFQALGGRTCSVVSNNTGFTCHK
jgi:hypothetical protein